MGEGPQVNEGIVLSGNAQVRNSALAAGRGATATTHNTGADAATVSAEAVRAALETIAELKRRLGEPAPGAGTGGTGTGAGAAADVELSAERRQEARAAADALEEELAAGEVDQERVAGRLERLRTAVGNATALLGLVASAQESIRAIAGG
ncbi:MULTISPECIES: hypothetical protein [unclassified Streptomyces]|uniref:hypothetical protein n=1 Tax=unclassified Streptomyces TaxID=2593676 RepID=UPI00081DC41D|nr:MULTISPECIES: hypothetical protein [unclassified Streptomyces]MYZ40374.1 hypothetical protein [Streptomyces sp. SID4917]SCG07416.1 hypothetical protein GA0115259_111421 [Streptomyces sp. MnatMP-M17]